MSCLEAFIIYTAKGDPIIFRVYKDNVDLRVISELFRTRVLHGRDASTGSPIRQLGSQTMAYLAHNDLFLVAIVRNNANIMMTTAFLSSVITLFQSYFRKVKEKHIKSNFVLIYELLDEVCDNGIPQMTDPATLKSLILQKGNFFAEDKVPEQGVTLQVTGQVAHRKPNIKYKKNEVFLDVEERVHCTIAHDGTPIDIKVEGRVVIKSFLSGMPECRLGLNNQGEDAVFPQFVNTSKWADDRVVTFVPPDGEFVVMNYRCNDNINMPFTVKTNVVEQRTSLKIDCTVKALFDGQLNANSVVVVIPLPTQTSVVHAKCTKGKYKYDVAEDALVWKIAKFSGYKEHSITADVSMVSTTKQRATWSRPPVSMAFNVPMFSASPLRVNYLKVLERSGYKVDKWVRKVCKNGMCKTGKGRDASAYTFKPPNEKLVN